MVGRAIDAWERLEEQLARLALFLQGIPIGPQTLAAHGKANGIFKERLAATRKAGEHFFIGHPDQQKEGEFADLMTSIDELSIKRHRIAHGHGMQVTEFNVEHHAEEMKAGVTTFTGTFVWRWGPAFYSMEKLRAGVPGFASWDIDQWREEFVAAQDAIGVFADSLPPPASP